MGAPIHMTAFIKSKRWGEREVSDPQDDGSGREEEGEAQASVRVLPLSYTFRKESDVTNRRTPSSMTRTKNTTNPIEVSQRGVQQHGIVLRYLAS
jgi:hypothetical protein